MPRVLLTGASGQIGHELRRALAATLDIIAPRRAELDLADLDALRSMIRGARPDIIVNAAAYTAVDRAESEHEAALRVNAIAPGVMAEEAKRSGALLVHYSTDYVFDGAKSTPYTEDDAPNPLNAYGRSKLAGDNAIRAAGGEWLILRTSWIYAARGRNFLRAMLQLARERRELRVVDNQTGAPTLARAVADATARALAAGGRGLYHYTAAGAVSWAGFAQAIFAEASARMPGFAAPAVIPIPDTEYPMPARRPANSRLDCTRYAADFGAAPEAWQATLAECMAEISAAPRP